MVQVGQNEWPHEKAHEIIPEKQILHSYLSSSETSLTLFVN
jgi:hypothetical protein